MGTHSLKAGRPKHKTQAPVQARHVPRATYRVQFNREFTFSQAAAITEYLQELGISHCYASPLFKAGPESTHGYDTCAFDQLNPLLGNRGDFDSFAESLSKCGLGLLVDTVPNHMRADLNNPWWAAVLEQGSLSPQGSWFDIDWHRFDIPGPPKVLLPILEATYAEVLESGKLQVRCRQGTFCLHYYDNHYPLALSSQAQLMHETLSGHPEEASAQLEHKLLDWLTAVDNKPIPPRMARTFRELRDAFTTLFETSAEIRTVTSTVVSRLNGQKGQPRSFDRMAQLLDRQHYRLAFWRIGSEELNYRRFFDVTELVSLRMESHKVFDTTHEFLLDLVARGAITGLRIDHPDGLWNPREYLERLQRGIRHRMQGRSGDSAIAEASKFYVVVEKILTADEQLPQDWPVDGTTGYDFLYRVNNLFVASRHRQAFDALYQGFTAAPVDFESLARSSKRQILQSSFASELEALTRRLKALAGSTRYGRDFTRNQLRCALTELIAAFPVYRTYATEESQALSPQETKQIGSALQAAKAANTGTPEQVIDFVAELLLLRTPADLPPESGKLVRELVMKFQQLTGPVTAKGLEDTAFYNYNRLVSLNEVGGNPGQFGAGVDAFHMHNQAHAAHWPHSLLATATHDTKRGEDVRARINVLSEMPESWAQAVWRWSRLNAQKKTVVHGRPAPDANHEYLLYQTLVGAWLPKATTEEELREFRERIVQYLLKAIKESKRHTSWTQPNPAYEQATRLFVDSILAPGANAFLEDFRAFHRTPDYFGRLNSLSQTLLKLTAPGVPDIYQGTELWDFSLVDPDNRRPVDYRVREQLLSELRETFDAAADKRTRFLQDLVEDGASGRVKLFLIWRTLRFRQRCPALFQDGAYVPLPATGKASQHVCAFARQHQGSIIITIVPRLPLTLMNQARTAPLGEQVWTDTCLDLSPLCAAPAHYRNLLTGETLESAQALRVSTALRFFPVALLEAQGT